MLKKATYQGPQFGSIDSLARFLSTSQQHLREVAAQSAHYYRLNPSSITDKKARESYTVLSTLGYIQERVLHDILRKVQHPEYIFGGPDKDSEKSAQYHSGKKIVMRDDARRFFYSVPTEAVQNMWQHFFRFPPDVARILTDLTTYKGFLPPGAQTSSDIASLIFWDREPQLEFTLRSLGYTYSRYVDDITVSSSEWVEISNLSEVKSRVYGMLRSLGIKQNRKKSRKAIMTSGYSQRVHNIVVNKTTLSLPKSLRRAVREEIAQLGKIEPGDRGTIQYLEAYDRAMGKAAYVERFHHKEGRRLKAELQKIEPTLKRPSTRRDSVGVH